MIIRYDNIGPTVWPPKRRRLSKPERRFFTELGPLPGRGLRLAPRTERRIHRTMDYLAKPSQFTEDLYDPPYGGGVAGVDDDLGQDMFSGAVKDFAGVVAQPIKKVSKQLDKVEMALKISTAASVIGALAVIFWPRRR